MTKQFNDAIDTLRNEGFTKEVTVILAHVKTLELEIEGLAIEAESAPRKKRRSQFDDFEPHEMR